MTFFEATAAVIAAGIAIAFLCWYAWCLKKMLIDCTHPSHFFSQAYPTSGLFAIVNVVFIVIGAAVLLMKITS
jgi:multisubunit Na+/H+ antiporter MnhB subunit